MRDLAVKVGVEAASLYNHIRSKAELLHDICFNVANVFFEHINAVEALNTTPINKLETLLRFHIRQMIENFEEVYVSDREWRYLGECRHSDRYLQRPGPVRWQADQARRREERSRVLVSQSAQQQQQTIKIKEE